MPKILLVEDDKDLTVMIKEWLEMENYACEVVHDGNEALDFIDQYHYDLIILDWELPGKSGIDVLRSYRQQGGVMPVIFLTGKGQVNDKMSGLDSGADDYLTKPFSMKELSARLRALLRRPPNQDNEIIVVGPLEMDATEHRLRYRGNEVQLVPKDFALLEYLMRRPHDFCSSEILIDKVWGGADNAGSSDALRTSIKRIRQKMDLDETQPSIIENIPREGYRLRQFS